MGKDASSVSGVSGKEGRRVAKLDCQGDSDGNRSGGSGQGDGFSGEWQEGTGAEEGDGRGCETGENGAGAGRLEKEKCCAGASGESPDRVGLGARMAGDGARYCDEGDGALVCGIADAGDGEEAGDEGGDRGRPGARGQDRLGACCSHKAKGGSGEGSGNDGDQGTRDGLEEDLGLGEGAGTEVGARVDESDGAGDGSYAADHDGCLKDGRQGRCADFGEEASGGGSDTSCHCPCCWCEWTASLT